MRYTYKATTKEGKIVIGDIEAKDPSTAASYLRSRQLLPIKISIKSDSSSIPFLSFFSKANSSDLVFFTRQLSSMLTSGLTLMQSLGILKNQVQKEDMVRIMDAIITDIEEGSSFSNAISKFPDFFSPIYISLVRAAESSGLLDKVLLRLADNLEKEQKLKSTVKGALMYPGIVVSAMIIVVIIMMVAVIPQLAILYENLNIELPLPTRIIMGISNYFLLLWPFLLGLVVILVIGYRRWYKTDSGKLIIDNALLEIPVFGKLRREMILTEFSRTMGLLVGSGALVVDAFRQTADIAGNILFKNAIMGVSHRVEKGISIGDAMLVYSLFPPLLVQMVKIGEQTGKLDDSLQRSSEYFEREVDQRVKTLTTAMEPFIMVILGVGVAFLIISIITPIYTLTSSIK